VIKFEYCLNHYLHHCSGQNTFACYNSSHINDYLNWLHGIDWSEIAEDCYRAFLDSWLFTFSRNLFCSSYFKRSSSRLPLHVVRDQQLPVEGCWLKNLSCSALLAL